MESRVIIESSEKNKEISFKKEKGKPIVLSGIFMEAGVTNANNRKYELDNLVEAVKPFKKLIAEKRALSELEHPIEERGEISPTIINASRVCARITSIRQEGNKFLGEAVVLSNIPEANIVGTPSGNLLATLLQYGTKLGWSSRCVGETINGVVNVDSIVTVDCVLNPSTGYMANSNADVIYESADLFSLDEKSYSSHERFRQSLKNLPHSKIEKDYYILSAFHRFIKEITT